MKTYVRPHYNPETCGVVTEAGNSAIGVSQSYTTILIPDKVSGRKSACHLIIRQERRKYKKINPGNVIRYNIRFLICFHITTSMQMQAYSGIVKPEVRFRTIPRVPI